MEILREEKDQSGVGDGIIFRQLDFHPLHGDKTFPPDIHAKSKRKQRSILLKDNIVMRKIKKERGRRRKR